MMKYRSKVGAKIRLGEGTYQFAADPDVPGEAYAKMGGHYLVPIPGVYVSEINLSSRITSGDIRVGTGFYNDHEVEGKVTVIKNLAVWPIK